MILRHPVNRLNDHIFNVLYSRSLVYNTCWEDPAVDRNALYLNSSDNLLVIASAGCNVLDYALGGAGTIHAVDMNPRQIALLELKLAAIRALEYEDFFLIFGTGRHSRFEALYQRYLREQLSEFAREYWDRNSKVFNTGNSLFNGLYFHGLSGKFAQSFQLYLKMRPQLKDAMNALLSSHTIDDQRTVYDEDIAPMMWSKRMNWVLSRQLTMSMLGVPQPQRQEVESQHPNGVAGFIREAIEYVFRQLPLSLNYFWRVYMTGHYSAECCPEYLKAENFSRLKNELVHRIHHYTCSVTNFLRHTEQEISKFVLLDHMDWMSSLYPQALAEEWEQIFRRARPDARIIFRSAHRWPAYLERVNVDSGSTSLLERLRFDQRLAASLHQHDRVHTYAGFHIAEIRT